MEFRILGPLEVEKDGRLLTIGGSRQRVLLSALLLHANRVVSRDDLIDAIWGETPPETASTALQGYISALRKLLGPDRIVTRVPGYTLGVDGDSLDARRFEELAERGKEALLGGEPLMASTHLSAALELWRGPPLADLDGLPFVRRERLRLAEIRAGMMEDRFDAQLALGADGELVPELSALVVDHPLRERLRGQLMLALYRSGRQAEALDAYRRGRRFLSDELGLEPGETLKQLERAILEQDPTLGRVERPIPPATVVDAVARPGGRSRRRWGAVAVLAAAGAAVGIALGLGGGKVGVNADSVAVVDAGSGSLVADVPPMPLGAQPEALAFGFGSVWVANTNDGTVARIDARTRKVVAVIGVGAGVRDIATGFGSVWVANGSEGTVTRIDPALNAPEETLRLAAENAVARPVNWIAVGSNAVWVTRGNELLRVDPATGAVKAKVAIPTPVGLAARDENVWVATQDEALLTVRAVLGVPGEPPELRASDVALGYPVAAPVPAAGSLWLILYVGTGQLVQVGPDGVTARVPMRAFPLDVAYGAGALWVVDVRGDLLRVDPRAARVVRTVKLRPTVRSALAVGDGKVWVAVQEPS